MYTMVNYGRPRAGSGLEAFLGKTIEIEDKYELAQKLSVPNI